MKQFCIIMKWFRPGDWLNTYIYVNTNIYIILTNHCSHSKLSMTKMGDLRAHLSHLKYCCKEEENKLFSMLVNNQNPERLFRSKGDLNYKLEKAITVIKIALERVPCTIFSHWMFWRSVWATRLNSRIVFPCWTQESFSLSCFDL